MMFLTPETPAHRVHGFACSCSGPSGLSLVVSSLLALVVLAPLSRAKDPGAPGSDADLFGFAKVGSALLTLSPEDWKSIKPSEPTRGPGGFGPGGFNPGGFLAQTLLQQLDSDHDSELSHDEFTAGFDRWFKGWDEKQAGFLDADGIRDGLNKDLTPRFGAPGGPGAPGAPGAPGGPGQNRPGGPGPGGPGGLQAQEGRRNGISGMIGINFEYVHADLDFADRKFTNVAVRYKGNGTYMDARNSDKKSFKVELNKFAKGQKLFDLTTLNLHNNITDPALMNETLAYALYREAGVPAPRSGYTRLAVSVPGSFDRRSLGLYTFVENPDAQWAKSRFGSKKGLILKPVTRELFVDKGSDWKAYQQAYDAKADPTDAQIARILDFAKLVSNASDEEFAARLPEFLDIDEFARFLAVTVWLSSTDSILMVGQNYVVYLHPDSNKFLFVPWDLDRAFGNFGPVEPEKLSIRKAWGDDNRFLTRVMNTPAARDAYLARLAEFHGSIFQPQKLNQQIDELAKLIRPAVAEEGDDHLARFDKALAEGSSAEKPAPEAQPGPGFPGMGEHRIRDFIKARSQSVTEQLAGQAEGRVLGGGGPFGGRNGPGGPNPGPGGPGGPGPNNGPPRPRFGLGNLLGPVFAKAADTDGNGQITALEFDTLATKWFAEWDSDARGTLNLDELQKGLSALLPRPGEGGRPGGPPAPPAP